MAYDPKCEELAEHFLPSSISMTIKRDLAEAIQHAVEGWLASKKAEYEAAFGFNPFVKH